MPFSIGIIGGGVPAGFDALLVWLRNVTSKFDKSHVGCDLEENVPVTQMLALQTIYNSTGGEFWDHWNRRGEFRKKNHWNFSGFDGIFDTHYPNPCNGSWQGVSCFRNWTHDGIMYPCSIVGTEHKSSINYSVSESMLYVMLCYVML